MRGIKSHAMVLAATSPDGTKVELVEPPTDKAQPGQRVYFEGYADGTPDAILNPKKKVWETIQPGLKTTDAFQASYRSPEGTVHLLRTDHGVCTVQTVANATIR